MATSYKIRLKRFNGTDYDTLNLISDNIIMSSGNNLQTDYNNLDGAIDDIVYVGNDAPTDPNTKIWLDTDASGASAVNSVNGKAGTVVLDADDVGALSKMDLLWTNASPTSSFSPQTVSIYLSDYSLLFIVFTPNSTGSSTVRVGVLARKGDEVLANSYINLAGTSTINIIFRYFTSSDSGVTFEGGLQKSVTSTSSASSDNSRCVPLYIYGIKG